MVHFKNSINIPIKNSLLVKTAAFTFCIFFLSFSVYLYSTFRVFSSSYNWIRSENISLGTKNYMESLKELDTKERTDIARQVLEEIKSQVSFAYLNENYTLFASKVNSNIISNILERLPSEKIKFESPNISQLNSIANPSQISKPVEWLNRSSLRIFNFSVDHTYNAFENSYRASENKLKKLKLLELKMVSDLVNGLLKITGAVSFVFFIIMSFFYFKKGSEFNRRIQNFFAGLKSWSDGDFSHRELVNHKDELALIQSHFNNLAGEIEKGRRKSIDKEKISHWQTVAKKMAHEVKNPLTPIQLIFSGIKRSYKGPDKQFKEKLDKSYRMLLEEVSGLRRLVDSFTNFSSLPLPVLENRDIITTIEGAVQKYSAIDHPHEIIFENNLGTSSFQLRHDRQLISQVLSNIIKNALEACGDDPSQIEITAFSKGANFLITIEDNGPGIPEDIQKNVFDAHFTTKGSVINSSDFGMGLGLSVCQKVIFDHGGDITFESVPHKTVFTISLPK